MATLFETQAGLSASLDALIGHYKELIVGLGGCSKKAMAVLQKFVTSVTKTVSEILPFQGPITSTTLVGDDHNHCIRKETVLAAFDRFYDEVLVPLDIPLVPEFVEKTYVDPLVRQFLRDQAENVFDAVSSLLSWYTGGIAKAEVTSSTPAFAVL